MRTLVVDDNAPLRETLRTILESFGGHVTEAEDGNDGLTRVSEAALPFDVIICDLRMPNRDGIQFLRGLAERGVDAGIILISGHEADVLAAAAEIGRRHALTIIGHLKKPFTRAEVRNLLTAYAAAESRQADAIIPASIDESDIRRGLADGEFRVLFQPKVDCSTNAIVGAEALARWHHTTAGVIPPSEFIPVAEETGVIDDLTDFVLGKALAVNARMREGGTDLPVAVNLSTRSMMRLDFADRLADLVAGSGAGPSAIIFEVTESRLAENLGALIETCARLRLMGFKLSIDDFGTGFSTLEQLHRLPVGELKIDRMFVEGAPHNPRVRHILEASLNLGAGLGLTCVCEGIGTVEEWELIRSLGSHIGQGNYIASPMPASQLQRWVQEWSVRTECERPA